MKNLIVLLIIALPYFTASAQEKTQKTEKKLIQVSVVPPLSTGKVSDSIIYHTSFNYLAGYNYGLQGVEFGGIVNITRKDAEYAQFGGIANLVGEKMTGVQAAGIANHSKVLEGVQVAGIANRSTVLNGAQISGVANSTETANGLQLAGVVNQTTNLNGAQVSGVVNYAKVVNGFQLGIINIADTIESGASFGLISIVKTGIHQFEISSNDVTAVNLSFRSGSNTLYGIFTAGIQTRTEPLWTAGLGFGTRFNLRNEKLFGAIELTGSSIYETEGDFEDKLNLLNKLSVNVGYRLGKRFLVNAGPVLNMYVTKKENPDSGFYGYNIGQTNFFDRVSNGTNTRMWLGYHVGIWF